MPTRLNYRYRSPELLLPIVALLVCVAGNGCARSAPALRSRVAVLDDALLGVSPRRVANLSSALERAGATVQAVSPSDISGSAMLSADRFDCLILPDSTRFPGTAVDSVLRFLREGGDLVLLGGHAFQTSLGEVDGKWLPAGAVRKRLVEKRGTQPLLEFEQVDRKAWRMNSDAGSPESGISRGEGQRGPALRIDIRRFSKYTTFKTDLPSPIGTGMNTLVLRARAADKATHQFAVELQLRNGERWIATVDLSPAWKLYGLTASDFVYHGGGPWPRKLPRTLVFSEASRISFGLATGYSRQDGPDHTIWVEDVGTIRIDHLELDALRALNLYTDLPPFQYAAADSLTVPSDAVEWLGEHSIKGPVSGTAAFAVPRAGESQLYPLLQTTGTPYPLTAAAMLAHYDGPFANSQWLLFGPDSNSFYESPGFARVLKRSLALMAGGNLVDHARRTNPLARDLSGRIGITHHAGKYHFSDEDFLNEGCRVIEELGTRTIKLWLSDPKESYPFNSEWPDVSSMGEIAQTPYFREALSRPFDVIYLETFAVGTKWPRFREGVDNEQAALIEKQFYDLTKHLLTEYRDTGKTFVLQNWEGDWALRPSMDGSIEPTPVAIQGMIDWLNTRQAGVDRARKEIGHHGVRVYHAAEMNLVEQSMLGRPGVVNKVLPHTRVDLASYSSYETRGKPRAFRAALEFMQMNLPPSTILKGNRVAVGEFGVPENEMGLSNVKWMLPETVEIALAYGAPHLLYWELYGNEAIREPVDGNDDVRGYWLIKQDGTKAWAWHYFHDLLR